MSPQCSWLRGSHNRASLGGMGRKGPCLDRLSTRLFTLTPDLVKPRTDKTEQVMRSQENRKPQSPIVWPAVFLGGLVHSRNHQKCTGTVGHHLELWPILLWTHSLTGLPPEQPRHESMRQRTKSDFEQ